MDPEPTRQSRALPLTKTFLEGAAVHIGERTANRLFEKRTLDLLSVIQVEGPVSGPSVLHASRMEKRDQQMGQQAVESYRDRGTGMRPLTCGGEMKISILLASGTLAWFATLYAFQKPFKEFSGTEYRVGNIPLPQGWDEKTDFAFARLMFPGGPLDGYQL